MQKVLNWLVVSSANPENVSLTLKGILLQYVAIVVAAGSVIGVPLLDTQVIHYIDLGLAVLGSILGFVGLGRKLYYQVKSI